MWLACCWLATDGTWRNQSPGGKSCVVFVKCCRFFDSVWLCKKKKNLRGKSEFSRRMRWRRTSQLLPTLNRPVIVDHCGCRRLLFNMKKMDLRSVCRSACLAACLCWNSGTEDDNWAVHILPADEEKHNCASRWKCAAAFAASRMGQIAQRHHFFPKTRRTWLSAIYCVLDGVYSCKTNKENPSQLNGIMASALWHCYNLSVRGEAAL